MIDFSSFADELQKIAAKRRGGNPGAIYSPAVAAHEAGHALVRGKVPGSTAARVALPMAASMYSGARLGMSTVTGGRGMSTGEAAAVSALGNVPVLADEAAASVVAINKLKNDKSMTKKDWKRAALQMAAVNSSYLSSPLMDAVTIGAAKAGLHPAAQLGLQLLAKPAIGKAWASLGMTVKGPKVTAKRAKEIIQATAPGTPVFAIKEGIPGGSHYVPPAGRSKFLKEDMVAAYGGVMSKRDLGTLQRKGGVLLAPLDPKVQAGTIKNVLPWQGTQLKSKFRRV